MIWDLTTDSNRRPILQQNATVPQLDWNCTSTPSEKQRVNELLNTKYAFASWTGEQPKNVVDFNVGMLSPQFLEVNSSFTNDNNMTFLLSGKASEVRKDRKLSLILPCCSTAERVLFDLSVLNDTLTSAIQIYAPDITTTRQLWRSIHLDLIDPSGAMAAANKTSVQWVTFGSNECRVGHWFLNTWLVLSQATTISQIRMCDIKLTCGQENSTAVSLMHVVLF